MMKQGSIKLGKVFFTAVLLSLFLQYSNYCEADQTPPVLTVSLSGSADYSKIQDAIDSVQQSGTATIYVAAGTYKENLVIQNKNINLVGGYANNGDFSEFNPVANQTIIDADQKGSAVSIDNSTIQNGAVGIAGFTLQNGSAAAGGGIFNYASALAVGYCTFVANTAAGDTLCPLSDGTGCTAENTITLGGGGIYCMASSGITVAGSTFLSNYARNGGGIGCYMCSNVSIDSCSISYNWAEIKGGGVGIWNTNAVMINNSIFSGNSSADRVSIDYSSPGFANEGTDLSITNCTLADNVAMTAEGTQVNGAIIGVDHGEVMIANSIIWNNSSKEICKGDSGVVNVTYSDVYGSYPGAGNLNQDPRFVQLPDLSAAPPIMGDYRLLPGSPCIDAGDGDVASQSDSNGVGRWDVLMVANTGRGEVVGVDMGALEFMFPTICIDTPATSEYFTAPSSGAINISGKAEYFNGLSNAKVRYFISASGSVVAEGDCIVNATTGQWTASLSLGERVSTITVTITSEDGEKASDFITVTRNTPPVANAGADRAVSISSSALNVLVALDGSGSRDDDGQTLQYTWKIGGANQVLGTTPQLTNVQLPVGATTVVLTVYDGFEYASDSLVVTVTKTNTPPVANAGADRAVSISSLALNALVSLDGSGSRDDDGQTLQYTWTNMGTGNILGTTPQLTNVQLPVGTTTVTLKVFDGYEYAYDDVKITVTRESAQPNLTSTPYVTSIINFLKRTYSKADLIISMFLRLFSVHQLL